MLHIHAHKLAFVDNAFAIGGRGVGFDGDGWDLVEGLVLCGPIKTSYTIINGKIIVDQGQLVSMDMQHLLSKHRAMTADLMGKA